MAFPVWVVAILLILAGLAGTLVPVLPGTLMIVAGALLQKWLLPGTLTWAAVGWMAAISGFAMVADFVCTLGGAKLFGGTKWGVAGAAGGAAAGLFFSLPALLLGSVFGAVAAEKWLGKRTAGDAWRAGAGVAVGFLISSLVRFGCALVMIGIYAASAWHAHAGGAG